MRAKIVGDLKKVHLNFKIVLKMIKRANCNLHALLKNNDLKQFRISINLVKKYYNLSNSNQQFANSPINYSSTKSQIESINSLNEQTKMARILNVAEKNDAAKNVARIMSRGNSNMHNGYSKFNKIYEFQTNMPRFGQSQMIFTSVSGHLSDKDFNTNHRKWFSCDPVDLFTAEIVDFIPDKFKDIERELQKQARHCTVLIIWTDCDREGN